MSDWTLASIKARRLSLEGFCQTAGCNHFFVFDLDQLITIAGPDYVVPDFIPDMVCLQCGGRLKTVLATTSPEADAEAPPMD